MWKDLVDDIFNRDLSLITKYIFVDEELNTESKINDHYMYRQNKDKHDALHAVSEFKHISWLHIP